MDIKQIFRLRLGAPRPRRPLAFVQPCPMGVTPLPRSVVVDTRAPALVRLSRACNYVIWIVKSISTCRRHKDTVSELVR